MADVWTNEEQYWRDRYGTRPYATGRTFDQLSGGYRYGVESAHRYPGREWNEVESDLRRNRDTYEHRGQSAWEDVKDAVRDAWDRITGKQSRTGAANQERRTRNGGRGSLGPASVGPRRANAWGESPRSGGVWPSYTPSGACN